MVDVSETVALLGAYFQLRRYQSAATSREQAIPDNGTHVAQNYEKC
jgi:hypothetical protein